MKTNKVIVGFLVLVSVFGAAFGVFMFVEAREAAFTPIGAHEELKIEVAGVKAGIRLDFVQQRLWQLEAHYGCIDLASCRKEMPEPVFFEYRDLQMELANLLRKK